MPDTEQPKTPNEIICIARIGNIQALVEYRGEKHYRRPTVKFAKLSTPEDMKNDPERIKYYEMEEISALYHLCDRLIQESYALQTLLPRTLDSAQPPPLPKKVKKK